MNEKVNCMRVEGTGKILGFEEHEFPEPFRKQGQQIGADGQTTCNCDLYCKEQLTQLQEQNNYLDKVSADLQDLCDRQAKMLGERDAVLKQALEALEQFKPLIDAYWGGGGDDHDEAITAIKEILK